MNTLVSKNTTPMILNYSTKKNSAFNFLNSSSVKSCPKDKDNPQHRLPGETQCSSTWKDNILGLEKEQKLKELKISIDLKTHNFLTNNQDTFLFFWMLLISKHFPLYSFLKYSLVRVSFSKPVVLLPGFTRILFHS